MKILSNWTRKLYFFCDFSFNKLTRNTDIFCKNKWRDTHTRSVDRPISNLKMDLFLIKLLYLRLFAPNCLCSMNRPTYLTSKTTSEVCLSASVLLHAFYLNSSNSFLARTCPIYFILLLFNAPYILSTRKNKKKSFQCHLELYGSRMYRCFELYRLL